MAQYRAIFKNAYLKGLASAAVLTTVLAAGQAQAAVNDGILESGDFVNTGSSSLPSNTNNITQNQEFDLSTEFPQFGAMQVTGGTSVTNANLTIYGKSGLDLGFKNLSLDNARLVVDNSKTKGATTTLMGIDAGNNISVVESTFEAKKSVIDLKQASIGFAVVNLESGSSTTLGGQQFENLYQPSNIYLTQWNGFSHIAAADTNSDTAIESATKGLFTIRDSDVTLNDRSTLLADQQLLVSGKSTITLNGTKINKEYYGGGSSDTTVKDEKTVDLKDKYYVSAFLRGTGMSGNPAKQATEVNFEASKRGDEVVAVPKLIVSDNAYGAIYSPIINLKQADVSIGKGATLILDGDFRIKKIDSTQANTEEPKLGLHDEAKLTFGDVTINNSGTLIIGHKGDDSDYKTGTGSSATSGADGTPEVSSQNTFVTGETIITGKFVNYDDIIVQADATTNAGSLTIDESQIFIKKNGDTVLDEGIFGTQGSVSLQGKGKQAALHLANGSETGLDLNKDVVIADYKDPTTNTTINDGKITVSGDALFTGRYFKLAKPLADLTDTQNNKLTIGADKLEIGDGSQDSIANLKGYNLAGVTVQGDQKGELTFDGPTDSFTIDTAAQGYLDYFIKTDSACEPNAVNPLVGKIMGDNLDVKGGALQILGGQWQNEGQSITLTSGSTSEVDPHGHALYIGADHTDEFETASEADKKGSAHVGENNDLISYNKFLRPTYLTWTGDFKLAGENKNTGLIHINPKEGANATLDLTQADVVWGKGTIDVGSIDNKGTAYNIGNVIADSDEFENGYGVLKIDGEQFGNFLTSGSSRILLRDEGVLYVDGGSNTINFADLGIAEQDAAGIKDGQIGFLKNSVTQDSQTTDYENYLYHTGSLALVTGVDATGEPLPAEDESQVETKLDIGNGAIYADSISIDNWSMALDAEDVDPDTDEVVVANGTLAVNSSLVNTANRRIVFGASGASGNANLILGFNKDAFGNVGTVESDLEFNGTNASLTVNTAWTVDGVNHGDIALNEGARLVVQTENTEFEKYGDVAKASLTADNLSVSGAATVSGAAISPEVLIDKNASAVLNTVQADAEADFNIQGHFLVNGLEIAEAASGDTTAELDPAYAARLTNGVNLSEADITVSGAGAVFEFGATATAGLITLGGADGLALNENGIKTTNWTVNKFGQVKFNFAEGTNLNEKDIGELTKHIIKNSPTGYLNLANANLVDLKITEAGNGYYEAAWDDNVEKYKQVIGHATTDKLLNTVVKLTEDISNVRGHYAALSISDQYNGTPKPLTLDGPTSLHHADANGGYFVSNDGVASAVSLNKDASLALFGSGTIGSITGVANNVVDDIIDENGKVVEDGLNSLYISNEIAEGETTTSQVTIAGAVKNINEFGISTGAQVSVNDSATNIGYIDLFDNSSLTVTHDLQSDGLEVEAGSSVKAENTKFIDGLVMGKSNTTDTLTLGDKQYDYGELLIYGGEVVTKNLTLANNSHNTSYGVEVGTGIEDKDFDDPESLYNEQIGYAGTLEVRGKTILNKGWLNVLAEDTQADKGVSFASLNELSGTANATNAFAGTLDGDLLVGLHGVTGVGVKDMATLKSELSRFYDGTNLTTDAQSILYLGQAFTIGEDQSVILTSQKYEDFLGYVRETNTKRTDKQNIKLDVNCTNDLLSNHVLYMGEGSLIVVDDAVAKKAEITGLEGVTAQAMLNFAGQDGTVIADGGDMFINGNVRTNVDYQVFGNAKIEYLDGTAYKVALEGEANEDKNINVSTKNNFLNGVVDEQGILSLNIDKHARGIMAGASDPVYDTIVAYARGYYGPEVTKPQTPAEGGEAKAAATAPVEQERIYSLDKAGNKVYQYENHFISETINTGDGSAVETVARLGVFGGMSQTAIAVAGTSSDAMAARMGIGGKNTQLSVADNGQGASLWVAPIYKSYNSDTFAIQSLNYGVDIDMYGLALGGDYSLGNGMKFGAMFNLGSGDTEGNGAATGTTNDFNYYGFGAFFGYSIDQFSVMADASYTIVDNDLEANTAIEKVSSSADASTYSIGVTAQYTIDMAGFEIAPHIGARYSSIDLDDYIIKGASGDIALYEAEKINVFSIPVGVSFAKEIVSESWTVKPSLDLTVTVNAGDDTADGNVYWAGAENLRTTGLQSEILDSVTYGATAGFSAKSGNFSLGLGVSYTGSSNTDELGVNANARFMF